MPRRSAGSGSEGHDVALVAREDELTACDLVVLDTASWSDTAVERLASRLPHAELLLLVDSVDTKPPTDAAMTLVKPVDVNKLVRLVRVVADARHGRSDSRDLVDFETLFCGDSSAIIELLRRVGDVDRPRRVRHARGGSEAVRARLPVARAARGRR